VNRAERATRWTLAAILAIALTIRLAWVLTRPVEYAFADPLPDQQEYLDLGRSLRGGELSFSDPRFSQRVHAYRTPGYPILIALCNGDIATTRIAQAIIDTSTVLAAWLIARRWLTERASLFAALLVAFNPYLIYFTGLLLTETLYTSMLAWGMALLIARPVRAWLAGGAVLALSILVRPGTIALPLILGVIEPFANRRAQPPYLRRWPLPVGTTMLILTILALLPWGYRNHRVVGQWVWTSTNGGITAYDGFNPNATGASDQSFIESMPHVRRMTETDRDGYFRAEAEQFRRENPRRSLELALIKIGRTWSPRPLSDQFSRPIYIAAAMGYSVPFYVLTLMGLLRANQPPRAAKFLLIAPAVYLTLAAAASVGSLRYRIPAEVPMAVLASAGLFSLSPLAGRGLGRGASDDRTNVADRSPSPPPPSPLPASGAGEP
jgi:4-amino-4-deoxy-L-arabinose transferase-like glycosyltransferase